MKVTLVILAGVTIFEAWKICMLSEKLDRYREKVRGLKADCVELSKKLKDEKELTQKLLQEEIFQGQKPYKNWFFPILGKEDEDENEGA